MDKMIEIRDMLCDELEKFAEHGEVNASAVEMIDKLSHSIKSIDTILAMKGYSEDDMSYRGRSYARGDRSYRRSNRNNDMSYARGRGRNANRDAMGRYSSDGYSMAAEDMVEQLREMMEDAPDEMTRKEFEKFIRKMEQM